MNKTALITGASSGIGHFTALKFYEQGYHVIALDRDYSELPNKIELIKIDLTIEEKVIQLFDSIDKIDIAINCAGVPCERKSLIDFTQAEISQQWSDNFLATFNPLNQEIRNMQKNGGGKIINISSITALRGLKLMAAYSIGKASITALTRVAAIENAAHNIQVNCISPATIDTPMIRKKYDGKKRDYSEVYYTGDCGHPKDVFGAISMFIENNFLTGHDLRLDGGLTDLCQI